MSSKNEHTKDKQQTKPATDKYRDNFDKVFKKTYEQLAKEKGWTDVKEEK